MPPPNTACLRRMQSSVSRLTNRKGAADPATSYSIF
jgi:hypothetical protein